MPPTPHPDEALKFLDVMAGSTSVTYQTFDDRKKDRSLARVIHEHGKGASDRWEGKKVGRNDPCPCGSGKRYKQCCLPKDEEIRTKILEELARLNKLGAGIFWMVNEGDGKGRSEENVIGVRAVFLDLDKNGKEKLKKIQGDSFSPHAIIETSPERFHAYWKVRDLSLGEFESIQESLRKKFGGDKVSDLPRVMRLPGFLHQKNEPYLSQIVDLNENLAPYSMDDIKKLAGVDGSLMNEKSRNPEGWQEKILEGVEEGQRNVSMARLAGRYLGKGLSKDEIFPILLDVNSRSNPPLDEKEVEIVLDSVIKTHQKNHPEETTVTTGTNQTDLGNAERLVKAFGPDIRYCYKFKRWFHWDTRRWIMDDTGQIDRFAKDTVRLMYQEASRKGVKKESLWPVSL